MHIVKSWLVVLVLQSMVLPDLGSLSNWLDIVGPEQLVEVTDNDDGSFTVTWKEEDGREDL